MKRIITCLFVFASILIPSTCWTALAAAEWYKGQLHCHSLWSDGDTLPELVFDWYRANGFHFVSLTDHNVLQTDKNNWKAVDQTLIQESRTKFGNDWVQTREEDDKTLVRLKPMDELAEKLNAPGKFLIIPGHEQNATVAGRTLHANAVNITETIPFPRNFPSLTEAAKQWRQSTLDNTEKSGLVGFWMLNHPDWPYYDIPPTVLIEAPEMEFLEHNMSSAPSFPRNPLMADPEKYWDIVNSFRLLAGHKPVCWVAGDDAHRYRSFRDHGTNPGHGWVVVRAEKLDANTLFTAMKAGDFYSSTGVEMKDIRFDTESKTLFVDVKPEEGVKYSIRFIGTKKGFDTAARSFDDPAVDRKPARTGLIYSEEIGTTFKTVEGVSAYWRLVIMRASV